MTGCDDTQADLLPFWFENVRRHCALPIVFADFGMGEAARAWCVRRGAFIDVPGSFDHAYLKKPCALVRSPYRRTLWLDPDCEVVADITPVFDLLRHDCAVALDGPGQVDRLQAGVICYRHGSDGFREWARACCRGFARSPVARIHQTGDQALLCWLVDDARKITVDELPREWNHLAAYGMPGAEEPARIIHHAGGDCKRALRDRMTSRAITP